jgi:TfoX/Sxy family transcriptional regulator of competence genes
MVFSEELAMRIRLALQERGDVVEKKMFGGLAFMVGGSMAVGVIGDELMARVGPDGYEAALSRAHVRPMDFTGKPLRGFVYVAPPGIRTAAMLREWVDDSATFAASAPKRKKKAAAPKFPKRTARHR